MKPWIGCLGSFSTTATASGRTSEPTKSLRSTVRLRDQQRERVAKRWSKIPAVSENVPAVYRGNTGTGIPTENHKPRTSNQEPKESPPTPRKRGKAAGAAGQEQVDWLAGLPVELDVPEFRKRWLGWVEHRKAIKKPVNLASARALFRITVEAVIPAAITSGFSFHSALPNRASKSWVTVLCRPLTRPPRKFALSCCAQSCPWSWAAASG